MNNRARHTENIASQLADLQLRLKRQTLMQHLAGSVIALVICCAVLSWFDLAMLPLALGLSAMVLRLRYWYLNKSTLIQAITADNLLLHFNRQFPALQESAQLTLLDEQALSLLQRLQKDKITPVLLAILAQQSPMLPAGRYLTWLLAAVLSVLFIIGLFQLAPETVFSALKRELPSADHEVNPITNVDQLAMLPITIGDIDVTITAPAYVKQPPRQLKQLDLSVLAGSTVQWRMQFSDSRQRYFLQFANGETIALTAQQDGYFSAETRVVNNSIYRITYPQGQFDQVHTLQVSPDEKPKIHLLSPTASVTELAKNANPALVTDVAISDDFGISKVEIIASIAKGSGEAVKFRDQRFSFDRQLSDRHDARENKHRYQKNWQLAQLGMEPGDELYFTVQAFDNKEPQAQVARSQTLIIRWLEDEQSGINSDGIVLDFMPEYVKSQRQLIIDTQALIAERARLPEVQFSRTSALLGLAQSDLKQKYGQYLGDEFNEGGGHAPHVNEQPGDEMAFADADNHGASADDGQLEHEHEHQQERAAVDKSGYNTIIAEFGHSHEEVEVDVFARQSPQAMMKQAIDNMWQAELQLMLAMPEQALPFEQAALKLITLAKKAERIYVKRLGFEPPPVSEKQRYQGDLQDILSYRQDLQTTLASSDGHQLTLLVNAIAALQSTLASAAVKQAEVKLSASEQHDFQAVNNEILNATLSATELEQLIIVKNLLMQLMEKRPAMLSTVALLERMQSANSFMLNDCQHCLDTLKGQLWQLIGSIDAIPVTRMSAYSDVDALFNAYSKFLTSPRQFIPAKPMSEQPMPAENSPSLSVQPLETQQQATPARGPQ